MSAAIKRTAAEIFDDPLRLWVPSRTKKGKKYLVQLDSFSANGECQCKDFSCRFQALLKQGITPQDAVARGLVKLKKSNGETKHVWDALRCDHIIEGRAEWADLSINAFSHANTKHSNPDNH